MPKVIYEIDTTLSANPELGLPGWRLLELLGAHPDWHFVARHGALFVYDNRACTADDFIGTLTFWDGSLTVSED